MLEPISVIAEGAVYAIPKDADLSLIIACSYDNGAYSASELLADDSDLILVSKVFSFQTVGMPPKPTPFPEPHMTMEAGSNFWSRTMQVRRASLTTLRIT